MKVDIKDKCFCLVAKRNSGKSELLRYIVYQQIKEFKKMYCICPSESVNKFYSDFIPETQIFDKYSEDWVEKLISNMTKINKGKPKDKMIRVLLILDDVVADHNFHTSKSLIKLFARGRHLGIGLIVTTQYINKLPPVARSNTDYLAVGQLNRQGIELLCKEYRTGTVERNDFIEIYQDSTTDYNFLLINNNSVKDNNDIDEIYGIIRTPSEFVKNPK